MFVPHAICFLCVTLRYIAPPCPFLQSVFESFEVDRECLMDLIRLLVCTDSEEVVSESEEEVEVEVEEREEEEEEGVSGE